MTSPETNPSQSPSVDSEPVANSPVEVREVASEVEAKHVSEGQAEPQSVDASLSPSDFIFVACQNGAESAVKTEVLANHPNLKLSFSRPGFITFKVEPNSMALRFTLKSALARTYGWSLGRVTGEIADHLVEQILDQDALDALVKADRIHVFERDPSVPGKNGFEPCVSPLSQAVGSLVAKKLLDSGKKVAVEATQETDLEKLIGVNQVARAEQLVFDIVLVEPGQWWFGFHFANTVAGRWVGGVPPIDTTVEVFSRAYFKIQEAILWSGIPLQAGDVCAEIGSAPGGACQFLLESGANVIGIDGAEMEEEILKHENFTHLRRKFHEVRKRDFKGIKWLLCDMNVAPELSLDMVEQAVGYEDVDFKGIIITVKIADWDMVSKIPDVIKRAKGWGFQVVKARQLAFNRREYCLVAIKKKFDLRAARRR